MYEELVLVAILLEFMYAVLIYVLMKERVISGVHELIFVGFILCFVSLILFGILIQIKG